MPYIHEFSQLRIIASDALLEKMKQDGSLTQALNVAKLPGILDAVAVMPDAHLGYGFPVGGVAATDGFISPGGIGFDINCGVRLLTTNTTHKAVADKMQLLVDDLFKKVPTGMGTESNIRLTHEELDEIMKRGVQAAIDKGFGNQDDALHCENNGTIEDADPSNVSPTAKKRGKNQLGTLGSGNHFLEIQVVDKIFDEARAKAYGLFKDQIVIMIHCGSRGLGHQICSDYLRSFEDAFPKIVETLAEKDLMYAPIETDLGQQYISAMKCAMNFAWANRHIIGQSVRDVFAQHNIDVKTLYDLGHNNAKLELHKGKQVYVHRKGAARAFPAGHDELTIFKEVGHPVLVPGSMGTASYVLVGTQNGMAKSFGSCCHGAGRTMSRRQASETFDAEVIEKELNDKGIIICAKSRRGIVDEAPAVYKDIDDVVDVCSKADIAQPVVRMKPLGVIKG